MANIKITMTSDEQLTTMRSLLGDVTDKIDRNSSKIQEHISEAEKIDLSQATQDTRDVVGKLYSVLEDDLALVENIVTIRNIENKSERAFNYSYRATAALWEGLTKHVEKIARLVVKNNIPVAKVPEKVDYSVNPLLSVVLLMVEIRADELVDDLFCDLIDDKGEENAN